MSIKTRYFSFVAGLAGWHFLPLLLMRLILAYGFYGPATMKWKDIRSIADWFGSIGIPAPALNAYLAATTELLGVILLILGLGTRFIAVALIIVMIVAIKTVHWQNGFEAGDNGYEIPLYYLIMLFTLFIYGPGKVSVDHLIGRKARH
ncbi:DoxX family protein [Chitinophaga pendula]|uniref:HvfX family Cu-binding RiPP maturation protein n=1 Tax=Chitinophaga TaxID=79328 RepID=UPI000BB03785|nr:MULTISPECIES: DoxX family protein [Chitinophaga]ASZ14996.1 DoxX family protein [Chitinophaga sp. MD30]UCJ09689.1 DoxX family protein [Chitinophaga pendula]